MKRAVAKMHYPRESCGNIRCDYKYLRKHNYISLKQGTSKYCKLRNCHECAPPQKTKSRKRYCTKN